MYHSPASPSPAHFRGGAENYHRHVHHHTHDVTNTNTHHDPSPYSATSAASYTLRDGRAPHQPHLASPNMAPSGAAGPGVGVSVGLGASGSFSGDSAAGSGGYQSFRSMSTSSSSSITSGSVSGSVVSGSGGHSLAYSYSAGSKGAHSSAPLPPPLGGHSLAYSYSAGSNGAHSSAPLPPPLPNARSTSTSTSTTLSNPNGISATASSSSMSSGGSVGSGGRSSLAYSYSTGSAGTHSSAPPLPTTRSSSSVASGSVGSGRSLAYSASAGTYSSAAPHPPPPTQLSSSHELPVQQPRGIRVYHHRGEGIAASPVQRRAPPLSPRRGPPRSSSLDHCVSSPGSRSASKERQQQVQWRTDTRLDKVLTPDKPTTPRMSPTQREDLYLTRPDLDFGSSRSGSRSVSSSYDDDRENHEDDDDDNESDDGSWTGGRGGSNLSGDLHGPRILDDSSYAAAAVAAEAATATAAAATAMRSATPHSGQQQRPTHRRALSLDSATGSEGAGGPLTDHEAMSGYSSIDDDDDKDDRIMQVSDRMLDTLAGLSLDAEDMVKAALNRTAEYAKAKMRERIESQRRRRVPMQGGGGGGGGVARTPPPLRERPVNTVGVARGALPLPRSPYISADKYRKAAAPVVPRLTPSKVGYSSSNNAGYASSSPASSVVSSDYDESGADSEADRSCGDPDDLLVYSKSESPTESGRRLQEGGFHSGGRTGGSPIPSGDENSPVVPRNGANREQHGHVTASLYGGGRGAVPVVKKGNTASPMRQPLQQRNDASSVASATSITSVSVAGRGRKGYNRPRFYC